MSFLAGRLAGKEGAYFFEESKLAVTRLAQKPELAKTPPPPSSGLSPDSAADVLPEVLRHSLPSKLYSHRPLDPSTLSTASKWSLPSDPDRVPVVSPDALNPLRAYVSLPQVTFGPRRWQLPDVQNRVTASTANDLRTDGHHINPPINPEKVKAAAEGLANVGKAFAVATAVVFGGGSVMFSVVVSKLDLQTGDNVGVKVRDMVKPSFDTIKEQVGPLRSWVEKTSKKWHLESSGDIKEKPLVKELSRILGVKAM